MARAEKRRGITLRSLISEALAGITQRPGRSALTALGTVLGVAVLVAVLGITTSASIQVSRAFSLAEATQLKVIQTDQPSRVRGLLFPADADQRVARINGVVSSTLMWDEPPPQGHCPAPDRRGPDPGRHPWGLGGIRGPLRAGARL